MYVDPKRNQQAGNLAWILPYCKPDLPRVAGAVVLFCVNNTMALIIPLLSGLIVDRVITQGHVDELTRLCVMMLVLTVVRVGSRYGCQMWMERFGQNSIYRLVSDEFEKLHELDFTYFNHTRTGDVMSRMTSDTDAIRHALSWVSLQALDCVVMFIGALAMMFSIDWRLALALACVTPPLFILTRGLSKHARPLFFDIRNSLAEMNSMVEENIEGNRVVKAFVRESYETEKFDERNDDYMQRNMAQAYNSRKYMPWLDGLGFSLQLITLGFGGFLVIKGYMTLGNLVAFNSYLWMLDSPIRQSGWLTNDWQRFNAACIKIRKLLTAESRIREKPEFAGKATQSTTRVGTQGTQGAQACIVAQDTFLFSDTIGSNISFGAGDRSNRLEYNGQYDGQRRRRGYDEQYVRRMAAIAGADGFISSMPDGYDTVVGERGVGLSGGQKQRLSLARALADNPSILIMDDTTSAVDMETEAEIQRHLRDLDEKKTIVTIAHRISSVKDSDLILVLEHGRIVERGTHDELVASHGRYWQIYSKQLGVDAGRSQGFEA